jgi:sulfite exporter TauE/SafE
LNLARIVTYAAAGALGGALGGGVAALLTDQRTRERGIPLVGIALRRVGRKAHTPAAAGNGAS